jgi:osmotically-inducible protein OsmY
MSRLISFAFGAAAGAAATHFLKSADRNQLRDQAVSKAKSGAQHAASTAGYAAGKAKGAVATATPSRSSDLDDVGLAHKVETEIFRDAEAPKGDVSVNVEAGVAYLRGTVADEKWIARLGDEAAHVDGIKGVNNLLHQPGKPAPAAEPRGAVNERI